MPPLNDSLSQTRSNRRNLSQTGPLFLKQAQSGSDGVPLVKAGATGQPLEERPETLDERPEALEKHWRKGRKDWTKGRKHWTGTGGKAGKTGQEAGSTGQALEERPERLDNKAGSTGQALDERPERLETHTRRWCDAVE